MSLQECLTADDVRERARKTREWRRQMLNLKPPSKPIAIPIKEVFQQACPIPITRVECPMTIISMPEPGATICPSVALIIETVARHYKVTPLDIKSERRTKDVVKPRMIAVHLARRMTTMSMPAIGRIVGGRDHTTVLHAARKIEQRRIADADFDQELRQIEIEISQSANTWGGRHAD